MNDVGRGARDRRPSVSGAVGVEQRGRSRSFDGNHTKSVTSWLVLPVGQQVTEGDWDILIEWTVNGHLSWVVIPQNLDL